MISCYLGLGSNIGDPYSLIKGATYAVGQTAGIKVRQCSSYYKSAALNDKTQPDYLNIVLEIHTSLSPQELWQSMQKIEQSFGRKRPSEHHASRTIDIDILLYGDACINDDTLTIPHTQLLKRSFVLQPLAEIAPHLLLQGDQARNWASRTTNPPCIPQKNTRPFSVITAYDASMAALAEQAGIHYMLVGDSLGNVIQGKESTRDVLLEDMVYHTQCVNRGVTYTPIITDIPHISVNKHSILEDCHTLLSAGATFVKIECCPLGEKLMPLLYKNSIPFSAHIGLLPQSVKNFRMYGKDQEEAARLMKQAKLAEKLGAAMIVLECVESSIAHSITQEIDIPTIGIGAGKYVDAQVLVMQDALGITSPMPHHAKNFMKESHGIQDALYRFVTEVSNGVFPD